MLVLPPSPYHHLSLLSPPHSFPLLVHLTFPISSCSLLPQSLSLYILRPLHLPLLLLLLLPLLCLLTPSPPSPSLPPSPHLFSPSSSSFSLLFLPPLISPPPPTPPFTVLLSHDHASTRQSVTSYSQVCQFKERGRRRRKNRTK